MDIDLSADDLAFRDEVRDFLRTNAYKPGADYAAWRDGWFAKAKAKGGWDVPKWPKQFGGPGWTPTQHYIWEQETATAMLPFDMPFGVGMLAPILMGYGSKEQQERFLPDIRARKVNWCQGYSEPGAGSDLAALKTKAELSADGKTYTVNGTKIWTTAAHMADWIFCLTRTQDTGKRQEGITFLLFPMKQPGIEVKPIITLGGSHTVNMVHINDVKVPVENRIGEEGKGWTYAKGLLQHERTGLAGVSRSIVALEKLKEQARGVKRGNGSLMDEPAFRAKVAALEVDLMALEFTELRSLAAASCRRRARTRVVDHETERHRDSAAHREAHRRSRRHLLGRLGSSGRTEVRAQRHGELSQQPRVHDLWRRERSAERRHREERARHQERQEVSARNSTERRHMNFDLSSEQQLLKDSVERFVADNYSFEARVKVTDAEPGFSKATLEIVRRPRLARRCRSRKRTADSAAARSRRCC